MEGFQDIINNILIADPVTFKGREALEALESDIDEATFFQQVYVEPFTLMRHSGSERENPFTEKCDLKSNPDVDEEWAETLRYTQIREINSLEERKDTFERHLQRLGAGLFAIKGGAGTGKTTYVHYLKNSLPEINFHICDFEDCKQSISFLGSYYDMPAFTNTWKFTSLILQKINELLEFSEISPLSERKMDDIDSKTRILLGAASIVIKFMKKVSRHSAYIKKICDVYWENFNIEAKNIVDNPDMRTFFSELSRYGNM